MVWKHTKKAGHHESFLNSGLLVEKENKSRESKRERKSLCLRIPVIISLQVWTWLVIYHAETSYHRIHNANNQNSLLYNSASQKLASICIILKVWAELYFFWNLEDGIHFFTFPTYKDWLHSFAHGPFHLQEQQWLVQFDTTSF